MKNTEMVMLKMELSDFYDDYAHALDKYDLDAWVACFTEDCHYRVISHENMSAGLPLGLIYCMNKNMLRDRVLALRETTMYEPRVLRHFISGLKILNITNDEIQVEANFLITESLSDQEPTISLVGQYQDIVIRQEDGFLLKHRDCVYDNYRIRNSLIIPV
ncbi:aromatic-ring-hydroxylating dioxygenase subunit beta [Paenalcaligenes sp. Me52]|uniref:aromatic-ring-hydroxylating dioxygenase subunit beta n=1 Tax=Paenalcaligenes sp. Me52 TaxID=3392038 RepID=UPI003D265650